jgi:hypothetical protein
MKIIFMTVAVLWLLMPELAAQKSKISKYETSVYTSDKLGILIQNEYKKQSKETRGLGDAILNAGKGIAGGYITSILDLGVNAIAGLFTQNANNKIKWEAIMKAENSYQETLTTVEPINNFYSYPSFDGPMDPAGMNFNGIGCLRTIDGDTTFYVSCHINPLKIDRIINHSKFELTLDTLIIDPYQCDLPNSNFDTKFSFEDRKNLQFVIEMRLLSSWVNELTELQKNQELGSFIISVPVSPTDLNAQGKLRYVRTDNAPEKYKIAGESFIIPRSYMGFRDEENHYKNSWGTGDYKVELLIKQTCGITDAFRKNWKADWKARQDAENDENFVQKTWKTIASQRWDEIGKKWVITMLKAPADMINTDLLKEMNLQPTASGAKPAGKK